MFDISSDDLHIYYSKGGVAWVTKCAGVYAAEGNGLVLLKKINNSQITALIDIQGIAIESWFGFSGQQIAVYE